MRETGKKRPTWLKEGFIAHRHSLLMCPPWRLAPIPLRNILARLEEEHLRHAGLHNGELYVAYSQFTKAGVSRRTIRPALDLGVELGLLEVMYREPSGNLREPNAYRLTYLPAKGASKATDEWQGVALDRARDLVAAFRRINSKRG